MSGVLISVKKPPGGVNTEVWGRGSRTSEEGALTAIGTMFTTSLTVYVEELGVLTVLPGTVVNDRGNLHALKADLPDMGDSDRVPPIGVFSHPCGGWPGVILTIDSSEGGQQ